MIFSRLFRSRWAALVWSAGIIWSAVSFVQGQDNGDGAGTGQAADINQIQALVDKLDS